ncbi:hypothetical protein FNH09_15060 [Streptomyces adustus]|uniref:Uncharacterized protein n=1 Tax=Streptomyces adustus TaxID=1609272 RepID=A0A5N8VD01_9ACTN|nr:hypothetical protein [Streptomyces adustus]MPY32542.1 hypothetical protein [Streptomyces adustus]
MPEIGNSYGGTNAVMDRGDQPRLPQLGDDERLDGRDGERGEGGTTDGGGPRNAGYMVGPYHPSFAEEAMDLLARYVRQAVRRTLIALRDDRSTG